MTKQFQGSGSWPTREAKRRRTTQDIRDLEAGCPSAFHATLQAARAFLGWAEIFERAAERETDPAIRAMCMDLARAHRAGDQETVFRTWAGLGRDLSGALKPAPEVVDE